MSTATFLYCTRCAATSDSRLSGAHARQALAALIHLWPQAQALAEQYAALTPDTWWSPDMLWAPHGIIGFLADHATHHEALTICDDGGGPERPWRDELYQAQSAHASHDERRYPHG